MVDTKIILQWFSRELVKRMEDKGITSKRLALDSRTRPFNIRDYMNGNNFPNPWTLVLMAENLDCTVDELLGYKDLGFSIKLNAQSALSTYRDEDSFTWYLRERIIQRMTYTGVSAEELAAKSGMQLCTIEKYLCVHSGMPRMPNLLRICDALDCTPSELIGY